MRIVHIVCGPGAGGAEIFVRDMAKAMVAKGHYVHLVFLQTAIESGRSEDFSHSFLSDLEKSGVSYSFIGFRARKNPLFGMIRLKEIIRKTSPDVVHAHLYHALFLLCFVRKIPVVFTKHSIQLGAPKLILSLLLKRVSAFVAICRACKDQFSSVAGTKAVQIDNGTSFKPLPRDDFSANRTVRLLYVGRLFPVKNVRMLLESCAKIINLDFNLRIAGEGPELGNLKLLAKRLGVDHKVIFLGNIEDVAGEMSRSDVFLLSSLSEGLPISLIEASFSGLPCLVTDVGGCREVVERCKNGFAIPSGDLDSYSEKLKKLIEDDELRRVLSINASGCSDHYSIERAVKEHLDLYHTVL